MQCELSVALQLEALHHFIERFASGSARRLEDPGAFGAAKTPKTLVFNPYQLPIHGRSVAAPQRCLTACPVRACGQGRSVLLSCGVLPDSGSKPPPSLGVAEDA